MASIHRLRNVSFPPFLCCRAQTNRSRKRQFDGKSVKYHQLAEEENLHVTWTRIYHTLSLSFSTETKLRASYKKQRAIKSPRVSQNGNNDSPSHPLCHCPSPTPPPPQASGTPVQSSLRPPHALPVEKQAQQSSYSTRSFVLPTEQQVSGTLLEREETGEDRDPLPNLPELPLAAPLQPPCKIILLRKPNLLLSSGWRRSVPRRFTLSSFLLCA